MPHAVGQLSLCTTTPEPQLLSPHPAATEACVPRAHALQQEKPLQWEAYAPQQSSPTSSQLERLAHAATKTQHSQK